MSEPTRREKIEAMLAEAPRDRFLRYSLAMELQKEGGHEESLRLFGELMQEKPPHINAFFMAARQLIGLRRIDAAREVLSRGIEEAERQGESHAASEMSELLAGLAPSASSHD